MLWQNEACGEQRTKTTAEARTYGQAADQAQAASSSVTFFLR